MMTEENTAERLVDAQYFFEEGEDEDALKKDFYRTKNKYEAAYLRARGFVFRGMEKVVLTDSRGRKKHVIRFCFHSKDIVRRTRLEYHNTDDPKVYNVNAKRLIQELNNVNSLIGNF